MTDITVQPPLDQEAAQKVNEEIEAILGQICGHELRLAASFARLGSKLREVKVNGYWQAYGYPKFSAYLDMVRHKINRQRSQVYAILSVAESLLPYMSEEQLETVGISKAHELRRLVREGGHIAANIPDPDEVLPEGETRPVREIQLMDYAARDGVTSQMLRAAVNSVLHIHEGPKGNWYDMGGFYALPDEKQEIENFWILGHNFLELGDETPEHEAKKQIMLAAVRECTGTWVGEYEA